VALVRSITKVIKDRNSLHSEVECGYSTFSDGGKRYLQLETYGSKERKLQGKTSQNLQLDETGARRLMEVIREAFPGLR
jgi:hypothetical protein